MIDRHIHVAGVDTELVSESDPPAVMEYVLVLVHIASHYYIYA